VLEVLGSGPLCTVITMGWYRMDFSHWEVPRPAPGKTPACQRVDIGLPTLKMGKPDKSRPNRGLFAVSSPFPSGPLCQSGSHHTSRNRGDNGLVSLRAWLSYGANQDLCPVCCWWLYSASVQGSHDSETVFWELNSRVWSQQITMNFCTERTYGGINPGMVLKLPQRWLCGNPSVFVH
jgi:hypothetical protein